MRCFRAAALFAFLIAGTHSLAQEPRPAWRADPVATAAAVTDIRQIGAAGVLFRAGGQWYRVDTCNGRLCQTPAKAPRLARPPSGGLPDGGVATHAGSGIVKAWYGEPTRRYDHGILGDRIEAGALVVEDRAGQRHVHRLPETKVFEDLTPRLADLDGDERAEVVTIATSIDRGASLAVFGLKGDGLREVAATLPIGRTHRWLNVAGIADFDGDGARDIAIVTTPHIGGTLQVWSYRSGRLSLKGSLAGFSNHFIGSRNLGLSAVADADDDGLPDLVVPDARRQALRIVSLRDGALKPVANLPLPARITHNLGVLRTPKGPVFLAGLEDGTLVAVRRQ